MLSVLLKHPPINSPPKSCALFVYSALRSLRVGVAFLGGRSRKLCVALGNVFGAFFFL